MATTTSAIAAIKKHILEELESESQRWSLKAMHMTLHEWRTPGRRIAGLASEARKGWHQIDARRALTASGQQVMLLHFARPISSG